MTLVQISSWINQALRFKIHPDQYPLLLDSAHKKAFEEDLLQFLVWNSILTTYDQLNFVAAGYVSAIAGDVGKSVVGTTSGSTGVLVSYDNTARTWLITTTENFLDGEAITITTGTGAGTLDSDDGQEGYCGPYAFPTNPAVRKYVGVTAVTEGQIFGVENSLGNVTDYGMIWNAYDERKFYKPGRFDPFAQTFTFVTAPSHDAEYRHVYFRKPQTITSVTADDALVEIPDTYHFEFGAMAVDLANSILKGEDVTRETVVKRFGPWWASMTAPYTPQGAKTNKTSGASGPISLV